MISFDGTTGRIYDGAIPTVEAKIVGEFDRIMQWADKYRVLKVRTNADTPEDAKKARELGAEGSGSVVSIPFFDRKSFKTSFSLF